FFFQAEDGIRDRNVTGVQTCALPIFDGKIQVYGPLSMDLAIDEEAAKHKKVEHPVAGHADILLFPNIDAGNITYKILVRTAKVRSEERRVGKECGERGWAEQGNEKGA